MNKDDSRHNFFSFLNLLLQLLSIKYQAQELCISNLILENLT